MYLCYYVSLGCGTVWWTESMGAVWRKQLQQSAVKKSEGLKMCGTIFFIEGVCEGGYEHLNMRFPPPSGILVLGGHIRWHHPSLETWVWGVCVTHMTIVRIDL